MTNENKKIQELEARISDLEDWIKTISKYWNGAENLKELETKIKQAQDFKKANYL